MTKEKKVEQFERIYIRDGGRCQGLVGFGIHKKQCKVTDQTQLQRCHQISDTKSNPKMLIRYYKELYNENLSFQDAKGIIDSDDNVALGCSTCNSQFNIGMKPEAVKDVIREYYENNNG